MSDVYMLNNVGESTPPCGTPERCVLIADVVLLMSVNACLPLI